jgi:hypothetical protein
MHFIKILLLAIAVELLCCFGVIEKEKSSSVTPPISIEKTGPDTIIDQKSTKAVSAGTPIQIIIR